MAGSDYLVGDIMSSPVITMSPLESVKKAATVMVQNNIGSIVVVDSNERLLGIVTKTDIVRHVVASGLDPEKTKIGDIMTSNPYYIFSDDPLEKAAEMMAANNIGHLPVLDSKSGKLVGIITMTDILRMAPHYITYIYVLKKEREAQTQERP